MKNARSSRTLQIAAGTMVLAAIVIGAHYWSHYLQAGNPNLPDLVPDDVVAAAWTAVGAALVFGALRFKTTEGIKRKI